MKYQRAVKGRLTNWCTAYLISEMRVLDRTAGMRHAQGLNATNELKEADRLDLEVMRRIRKMAYGK